MTYLAASLPALVALGLACRTIFNNSASAFLHPALRSMRDKRQCATQQGRMLTGEPDFLVLISPMSEVNKMNAAIAAIEAWSKGDKESALSAVGVDPTAEVDVAGGRVWITTYAPPSGGNSPLLVRRNVELTGTKDKCALAAHILTTTTQ